MLDVFTNLKFNITAIENIVAYLLYGIYARMKWICEGGECQGQFMISKHTARSKDVDLVMPNHENARPTLAKRRE